MDPRKRTIKNVVALFFTLFLCLFAILQPHPALANSSFEIVQEDEAYVGQEVSLFLEGLESFPEGTLYEWSFSGAAKGISLREGGTCCAFTPIDVSIAQASVVARSPQGDILQKAELSLSAKEFEVRVHILEQEPFLLWAPSAKEDVPADRLVAGEPIHVLAELIPEFKGKARFLWRADASTALLKSEEGPEATFSRSEIGESELTVSVVNEEGIFLGQGNLSADISISRAEVQASNRRREAWHKWLTHKKLWDEKRYEEALKGVQAAAKLDPDTPEIAEGLKSMTADFKRIQRLALIREKAEVMLRENKLSEALTTYRRGFVVWPTEETQADIKKVETAILDLKIKEQEIEWLRDTAATYEQEGFFKEALEIYQQTQEASPSQEVSERVKLLTQKLSSLGEAERLAEEGKDLEKKGKLSEALESYRASLKLRPDAELKDHTSDLENVLKERKTRAAALVQEGISLYRKKDPSEALARFKESQLLWPLPETKKRITALEKELKGAPSRAPRTAKDFGIGTKADASRLFREGDALYQKGLYREALEHYRKSYGISKDPKLAEWIQRVEVSLKEYEAIRKANETIKAANNLYNLGRHKEALAKYKESLKIHANAEVITFIKQLEAMIAKSEQEPKQ
ncbi:MAG: hypothetical protein GX256_04615 [Fretibacterium sp.]|nr:hypothetical protein [Fretibacterium sp.]